MGTPVRPYSPWRRAGDLVVISGQLGLIPGDNGPVVIDGGAPVQLRQALTNAKVLLGEAGASFYQVIKGTLFLISMSEFVLCNEVWMEFFSEPRPTRSAVVVLELPRGAKVEVELWAHAPLPFHDSLDPRHF
jgi:2-iminobutanoate/2-iminopropanoate deaminase